jgi:NADH-quinone oxidoreductase subunit N
MTAGIYLDLAQLAAPEIIVVLTALAVLAADLFVTREMEPGLRVSVCAMFATAGCGLAIAWLFAFPQNAEVGPGMIEVNGLTRIVKACILALGALTVLAGIAPRTGGFAEEPSPHTGEYFALLLLATAGMMLLVSARDLLILFICLELSTVPLYVLAGFDKQRKESAEGGLKFFLFGAVSTALTLFGFSLVYGLSGSTNLQEVNRVLSSSTADPLAIAAMVMVVAGMGFKVAAAPFHLWAPDVYQSAPVSAAAFIASASKLAGFFAVGVVLLLAFGTHIPGQATAGTGWLIAVGSVSAFSMLLGNLAAIVQGNVRRLLAFSAVGHAGYMLLALLPGTQAGLPAIVFYAFTYGLSTAGAFLVAGIVQDEKGSANVGDFAGLGGRSPVVGICMMIFLLSLAGIPPLAGFIAKFYVFATLLDPGPESGWRLGLLFVAVGTSAVSLYYYLKVLKSIFVTAPGSATALRVSPLAVFLLALAAGAVVVLGCYPEPMLNALIRGAMGAVPVPGL